MEDFKRRIIKQTYRYYNPSEHLSLDETTVFYGGYHPDVVYNPMKPISYGIKAYTISDSKFPVIFEYNICRRRENQDE